MISSRTGFYLESFHRGRFLWLVMFVFFGTSMQLHSQCSSPANAIVAENCLPGNSPNEWDIQAGDAGDLTIQGFSTDISVLPGSQVFFKINTPATNYSINIYRMGYYGGQGARKVATISPSVSLPQNQPACLTDAKTMMTDCGNWAVSASWTVPPTAVSGIYFAHLVRSDTGGDSHIVFIVRNDASTSKILYQTSDTSWVAYNYYGNGSLYGPGVANFDLPNRTFGVSYNRPVLTRGFESESNTFVFGAEFPMVQWLEANGFDVSYSTGVDSARNGALIKNHKIFMDSGHDEYVSGPARANIQAARDAGVNLAFFSGNEFFWKTRWMNSIDASNTPFRSLICYKETLAFAKLDPGDPPVWTGTWRDPSFSPPADGGMPENALTGTLFLVNGTGTDNLGNQTIKVPAADGQMRFWRNTSVARLGSGASYTLVPGSLGYEWDIDADNGFRPAGAFQMSTSTYQLTVDQLLDYGGTYGAGTATHHLMLYRAPSGALVFGAGTINWAWGLNSNHDNPFDFTNPDPDVNMQQATINLFADMGAQPATIQPGLSLATASTDTTPPHSTIVSPANGASVNTGNTVTVTGTASDAGGVVGGVEFSGDGGQTWHPATGRANWTYTWTPSATGTPTLLSRAVDDSGNLEAPIGGVRVTVAPQTCPCTVFGTNNVPSIPDSGDGNGIEVGVKFRADSDGSILGIRFYKSAANVGTHVGHLWSSSGQLLGTATFSGESASGWQQVNFSAPIAASANTTYIASYLAPQGHYSSDSFYFEQSGHDNPPLHALANGVDGTDGVYFYGASGGFPTSSYNATNYWVDVIYASSNTYAVSGAITGIGGAGALVSLAGPENLSTTSDSAGNFLFDGVVNGNYTVTVSNPGVSFSPASLGVTVNFAGVTGLAFAATVTNPLSISGTITGGAGATVSLAGPASRTTTADGSGNYSFTGLLSGSYTVSPSEATYIFMPSVQTVTLANVSATNVNFTGQVCTCISIFQPTDVPAVVDSGDGNAVELGMKFTADSPAFLTGIRFYKAATNTGTHVGHLWTASGVLLATATFPGETASGWQQGYFSTPVQLTANTVYVASYFAPVGHYSASTNYFASSGVDRPPLHALMDGVSGGNDTYVYGINGTFPNSSFQATNYWVDVLYAAQPYTISGTITGGSGAGISVSLTGTSRATTTTDANGNFVFNGIFSGAYSVTPTLPGYIFVPGSQSLIVSSANVTGVNFSVPASCPCDTVWQPSAKPTAIDGGDPQSIEVGTKIRSDQDGYVLGIRFYKAVTNTGSHVGNLWAADGAAAGTLLATGTFVNETASGWQQLIFANPVPVSANVTYVASYLAPVGHYSGDSQFFATANVDSPPLHALATGVDGANGVYMYGPSSTYPNTSFGAANYWVDLIYAPSSKHSIAGVISGAGGPGASVVLSGSANASTIADAKGNYSFASLTDGTYGVTPSAPGYIVSPSSQSVTLSGAHSLAVNFTATVPTFAVSGTVTGAPGIAVSLSGSSATQSTVADSNGNYLFSAVPNGSYSITPSNVGFAVTPASQTITVQGAAVTNVNFTGSILVYSISGTITGGAGATVSLAGPTTATTTADATGAFSFAGLNVGTYTIVPNLGAGKITTPGNLTVTLTNANFSTANFIVPATCPCDTIFPSAAAPVTVDFADANPVEVGVKFRVDADAYVLGVRFYKAFLNTGTHIGKVWTGTGTLLGTATFSNESSSGWQQVLFTSPIAVVANTTYVVSYFAPAGHYSADVGYFANTGVDAPPLHALPNGIDGPNGVFLSSATGGFPNQSFNANASNYWVDVIYTPSSTFSIGGFISGAGGPGASVLLTGAAGATTTADTVGHFIFNGLANGAYAVTPSASGYAFTPSTLNTTINNAHALQLSFTTGVTTYTLSGTVTGAGATGATVTLSGGATASTVTDTTGAFSFTGLANGSYTVVAGKTGFSFTPPSQAVTINGANAITAFSSVAQTYTLSGSVSGAGAAGATVSLSGGATANTVTSNTGTFAFTGLANGSYTVGASKTGYNFTPASQSIKVNGANVTASFSSVAQTYVVSGTISGAGGSRATVTLSGTSAATTTANATGGYSFTVTNGTYSVAVARTGYTFTPASQAVSVSGANVVANFTSATQTFTISGTVAGTGGGSALVTLSGTSAATVTASGSGTYSFTVTNGTYVVTPSRTGYTFTPSSQSVTVANANVISNFTSIAQTPRTISGTITGAGASGASVTLSGSATFSTTTTSTGSYNFPGLFTGTYVVAVARPGYSYSPASQKVTISNANVTANFASTALTYSISGTISGSGGNGATVRLTGTTSATTTASSTGTYSFLGLPNGSYSVAASKTGYSMTPANQALTINGSNVTQNFTSSLLTFTLSGTISGAGGNGAKVNLTGGTTASTTASASGVFSFTGIPAGSYTLSPTKSGYTFSPSSQSVAITTANATVNFSSAVTTYSISGTISGPGGSRTTVTLAGAKTLTTTTNSSGAYSFTGLANGTYTVSASKVFFSFTPTTQSVTINGANMTANFGSVLRLAILERKSRSSALELQSATLQELESKIGPTKLPALSRFNVLPDKPLVTAQTLNGISSSLPSLVR